MSKNAVRNAFLLPLLTIVQSFMLGGTAPSFFTPGYNPGHMKSQQQCSRAPANECKLRLVLRPMHMNHVSEHPFMISDTLITEITSGVGTFKCNVSVRIAIDVQDMDAVALLRCRFVVFH
jgi:hypothetical protein